MNARSIIVTEKDLGRLSALLRAQGEASGLDQEHLHDLQGELKRAVVGHMRKLSKSPRRVRSIFGHKTFRYAA